LIKAADQYIPIQEAWIFKEKKFESPSVVAGTVSGILSTTAAGHPSYDGLPRDEDLEAADMAAAAAANIVDQAGYPEDDDIQPPNVHHNAPSRSRERGG